MIGKRNSSAARDGYSTLMGPPSLGNPPRRSHALLAHGPSSIVLECYCVGILRPLHARPEGTGAPCGNTHLGRVGQIYRQQLSANPYLGEICQATIRSDLSSAQSQDLQRKDLMESEKV